MNIPIEFSTDSIPFLRISQFNNSANNSMAFNEMDPRFTGFDLEPINFNNFEGSLESRLNRELGVCPQTNDGNENAIPTSPIPSSPNTQVQGGSFFQFSEISNKMEHKSQNDFMPQREKQMPNRQMEPLVLYPFRSVYDVEIAVQQMRAYEASRFAHADS